MTSSGTARGPRAVLLDSGGVLMRPIGGRWNPRADFEETILSYDPTVTPDRFAGAIAAGEEFFAASATTPDYNDYYRVLVRHLGLEPTPALLADLLREVPVTSVLEVFPDVVETLEELRRRGVRMAVVSDSWPGLPETHAGLGIARYFDAYAISAVLGCRKPDPRMYRHASEALGMSPGECVFVDDDAELVAAAIELGYVGRALCREGGASGAVAGTGAGSARSVPSISTLTEVLDLF